VLQSYFQLEARMIIYANPYQNSIRFFFPQLDALKLELLVIVNKNVNLNCFSRLLHTARHAMKFILIENLVKLVYIYGRI
jgi:hypothetical protein